MMRVSTVQVLALLVAASVASAKDLANGTIAVTNGQVQSGEESRQHHTTYQRPGYGAQARSSQETRGGRYPIHNSRPVEDYRTEESYSQKHQEPEYSDSYDGYKNQDNSHGYQEEKAPEYVLKKNQNDEQYEDPQYLKITYEVPKDSEERGYSSSRDSSHDSSAKNYRLKDTVVHPPRDTGFLHSLPLESAYIALEKDSLNHKNSYGKNQNSDSNEKVAVIIKQLGHSSSTDEYGTKKTRERHGYLLLPIVSKVESNDGSHNYGGNIQEGPISTLSHNSYDEGNNGPHYTEVSKPEVYHEIEESYKPSDIEYHQEVSQSYSPGHGDVQIKHSHQVYEEPQQAPIVYSRPVEYHKSKTYYTEVIPKREAVRHVVPAVVPHKDVEALISHKDIGYEVNTKVPQGEYAGKSHVVVQNIGGPKYDQIVTSYEQVPKFNHATQYDNVPKYDLLPNYEPIVKYEQSPRYHPAPKYNQGPQKFNHGNNYNNNNNYNNAPHKKGIVINTHGGSSHGINHQNHLKGSKFPSNISPSGYSGIDEGNPIIVTSAPKSYRPPQKTYHRRNRHTSTSITQFRPSQNNYVRAKYSAPIHNQSPPLSNYGRGLSNERPKSVALFLQRHSKHSQTNFHVPSSRNVKPIEGPFKGSSFNLGELDSIVDSSTGSEPLLYDLETYPGVAYSPVAFPKNHDSVY